jgi:hypothetical protein
MLGLKEWDACPDGHEFCVSNNEVNPGLQH